MSEGVDQTGQKRKAKDGPDEPKRRKLAAGKSTICRARFSGIARPFLGGRAE